MNTQVIGSLVNHPLVVSVGWMLVHFVWQATLVGVIVALVLAMLRRQTASVRYSVACIGLVIMTIMPLATLVWLIANADAADWMAKATPLPQTIAVTTPNPGLENNDMRLNFQPGQLVEDHETEVIASGAVVSWSEKLKSASRSLQGWLPWFVLAWIAGVVCLAMRLLIGLSRIWRWYREGAVIVEGRLHDAVKRLAERMNMKYPVRLLESARATVPAVIGWMRPAILVPTSMLSGLTTAELESILAHELAHIRRHDYLVNLLQSVVETVLFYHPAVWWLSHRIRSERENCCDDIAVTVCGDRVVFAQALARMEEIRCGDRRLVVAANGGSLLGRIRRIVGAEPVGSGLWWPAGAIVLGSLGLLLSGIWITAAMAEPAPDAVEEKANDIAAVSVADTEVEDDKEDGEINTRKSEFMKKDTKTGIEKRVFTGIELTAVSADQTQVATTEMIYSNLFMYSFIPARIAKDLGAIELGEIDFGATPPNREHPRQEFEILISGDPDKEAQAPDPVQILKAHEVMKILKQRIKVVPYPDDVIWIPGHLGFYDMNQTQQHVFKIVRIEKVDLGVGPAFGPVNALVLDDANSDFGVLGSNWTQQVRGDNGEGLWFEAATGTFHFMAPPLAEETGDVPPESLPMESGQAVAKPDGRGEMIRVVSSGHDNAPARMDRHGITVLASHTYPQGMRQSTGRIEVNGVELPIDVGVDNDGVTVYQTLMYDIVAIETESKKMLWNIDWGKTMPMWITVSIVELDGDGGKRKAVELYSVAGKTRELIYSYHDLYTGEKLKPPTAEKIQDKIRNDQLPDIRVVEKIGNRVVRMAVGAFGHGRSAVELVQHFSMIDHDISLFRRRASTTNMETIVSAVKPNYVIGKTLAAAEVLFDLPEGSGMRAEFSGENVEMTARDDGAMVVVTGGKVDLIDAGGVIRAWASPDGGAEQLVIDCNVSHGEVVLSIRTRRLKADADHPSPPVQVVMNIETGAPPEENNPPHRGIRYEILSNQETDDDNEKFARMKMKWWYDLKRLAEEAEIESGLSLEELIHGKGTIQLSLDLMPRAQSSPSATGQAAGDSGTSENSEDDTEGWGELAQASGLRSRLTLTTENPTIGQPLLFKLEVKNFSDKPTEIDPQRYAPFRVLRVENEDFSNAAPFIGMTPQTVGQPIQLEPGQTHLLWENVDASQLYLLAEARKFDIVARGGEWAASSLWKHSNRVKVALQHGALSPLQQVIAELLPELPPGWKLSSGFGGIYISHSPTNLKADATNIQLAFLDEEKTKALSERKRPAFEMTFGLGKTVLGEAFLIAPADAANLWRNYKELIEKSVSKIRLADRQPNEPEENNETTSHSEPELPWSVSGIVTNAVGEPFAGVTVKAHTGFGTLFNTGSGVTDENGRYEFPFGPGIYGPDPKLVQAATISVSMEGFTEKNLHRQGDCIAALEQPDEIEWGDKTTDDLFLPGKSKEINFVMVPAARMIGTVIGRDGDKLDGVRVSLVGEDMPPSSSVASHTRTDKGGRFELTRIPTGFKFQLLIEPAEAKPPWQAWASPPLVFTPRDDGLTRIEYSMHGKPVDFSFQHLFLTLNGNGVNWKTALKVAGKQPLELSWDGLSTEAIVSASMAFLQLGENNEE